MRMVNHRMMFLSDSLSQKESEERSLSSKYQKLYHRAERLVPANESDSFVFKYQQHY